MSYVDLHSHSTCSDGTFAPAEVVRRAHQAGLSALALTDHDTVSGLAEAGAEARRLGLDLLPGIEISAICPVAGGSLHILGYGVDPESATLTRLTRGLLAARDDRNPRIIRRLRELGIDITMEEAEAQAPGDVLGRPHIASLLARKKAVGSIKEAFDKYLGEGGLAYFAKETVTPRDAIAHIREAGGVAVLAHAVRLRTQNDAELETVVKNLADLGLGGIETLHSDHNDQWVGRCDRLAGKFDLVRTGGSDFHGANKADISIGMAAGRRIPRAYLDQLQARIEAGGAVR